MFNGFLAAIVVDVVGSRLGAEQNVIADVLLDEAVPVLTADDGVGQIHVLNDGLQLSPVLSGDPAAKDHGDLVRLTDGRLASNSRSPILSSPAGRRKMTLSQSSTCAKNNRGCQPACFAFPFGEERRKRGQPLLAAGQQIASRQGIGQFL
jgi:hypothetical protein